MPGWRQVLSTINPLRYEIDALRRLLIGTPATCPRLERPVAGLRRGHRNLLSVAEKAELVSDAAACRLHDRGHGVQVSWYRQSALALAGQGESVFIEPFGDRNELAHEA